MQRHRSVAEALRPAEALAASEFQSHGLKVVCDRFREGRKYDVLDLGSPSSGSLAYFGNMNCRLHIEDLFQEPDPYAEFSQRSPWKGGVSDQLIERQDNTRFDLIIAWDFFNYMDITAIARLMSNINKYCEPGTLLFFLISTFTHIPTQPSKFTLMGDSTLRYEPSTVSTMLGPRYTPRELEKAIRGFRILNLFLLQNGLQEYLFTFE
ncbi:MAG: class I SAM-dependent methyltransferase [Gammaproteobacteria bacterium]|nr:class I SAM-dependent methyltransferase [Gammaproteobacteria bacterium]